MTSSAATRRAMPENGILLHIGPHKTGTSALQSALVASREALQLQGVLAPEPTLLYQGVVALTGTARGSMAPGAAPSLEPWDQLDEWVRSHPDDRLVLSSEWFDDFTPEMIATLRDAWGGHRLTVMVTVRSLERIMPSAWQQTVKTGAQKTYSRWLTPLLKGPQTPPNRRARLFWYRHDHAALVERWGAVVGIDSVVVVVADEREPDQLYRRTEQLLGLPERTITPGPRRNRSLTVPEIAAVRAMYREVLPTDTVHQRHKWLQRGAVFHLVEARVPPKDEPRLRTPAAQVARMRQISQDIADRLIATGVSILGDVSALVPDKPLPDDPELSESVESTQIDPQIAALLVAGLYRSAADAVALAYERADRAETVRRRSVSSSIASATQTWRRRVVRR